MDPKESLRLIFRHTPIIGITLAVPAGAAIAARHLITLQNQHHFRDFSRWSTSRRGGEIIDRAMGTAIDRDALKSRRRIEFIRTLGTRSDDSHLVAARHRFAGR